ncbi:hypothetical protein [Halomonas urumqiensis]|uniref:Uncharacterized protein n=1 Tax=Halomonas urumqiensis TaxID=1684789 RepID=A0A2N7UDJ7_9GAMM|nr:hypothetical protein [Halomonas urumqiensis]PMR78536.1 hypothetical protein C1H70_17490 [Halomonas urumqiensis]PTB03681.1 hypothetical protein C6V82_04120 [Halomonas urumqiensis]GHE20106.1 hypothetical protein GCM10017767_06270 [Halomonas urumqiensis]
MAETTVKPNVFERHLQTGIQLTLVALLAWAGLKLVTLGEHTAVLRERLVYQGEQIESLRRDLRDWSDLYYRKSDANREIGSLQRSVDQLDERVSELESNR